MHMSACAGSTYKHQDLAIKFCPYKVSKEKMTSRRSGGLQFFVRRQTPLLLDSYPSPCYTTRFFEPNFKKHAVVFCKPLLLGISPKNLVLMKVKHLLFLGKLLGLRPRSEWVNTTRVPWPLGGHMKDCFIDSVKFKRLMKVTERLGTPAELLFQGGIAIGSHGKEMSVGMNGMHAWQLDKHTVGYLTYKGSLHTSLNTTLVRETEPSRMQFTIQLQLGVPNSIVLGS